MDFAGGRSWLGGLPVLGGADWPRNSRDGDALHFVVQVALADLPEVGVAHPREGTLAFFVESDLSGKIGDLPVPRIAGAVVWSADPDGAVTNVPRDCGAIYRQNWNYYWITARSEADAPRVFPRWPLQALAFACPNETSHYKADGTYADPRAEAYALQFADRITGMIGHGIHEFLPARDAISWRVIRVIVDNAAGACAVFDASAARGGQFAERHAEWAPLVTQVRGFVADWDTRCAGTAPDDTAGADIVADLTRAMSALAREMKALKGHFYRAEYLTGFFLREDGSPGLDNFWNFEDAIDQAFRMMCVGTDAEYQALPAPVRSYLETPTGGKMLHSWNQMFGAGTEIQDVGEQMAGKVLLLQVRSDYLVGMTWGDVGFVKFWIPPKDLAAGRWDNVVVTFEGS